MTSLLIILAALILPALCYIAWKWLQQKTLDFVFQERDTKGYPTEEEVDCPNVWRRNRG